ncbi:1,4-dihydroxy-6-naphthoate synthase [Desulfolithobacter sp.]
MSSHTLSIGYSPCPNDTYIFYGLIHGLVPHGGYRFSQPRLEDVETLNRWAMEAKLDVTKLSFHALGHVLDDYVILDSGAALGRGCGPLLVTSRPGSTRPGKEWRIGIPGEYTTAALFLRFFAPECHRFEVLRFDRIMEQVSQGRLDAGVIIHESRFTYVEHGLFCMQDLGAWWEEETGLPVPLGCIAARRSLSEDVLAAVEGGIRGSVLWARAHGDQCRDYIKEHARELDGQVIENHIGLYVNDFTVEMGEEGRKAVEELLRRGRMVGLFPDTSVSPWRSR